MGLCGLCLGQLFFHPPEYMAIFRDMLCCYSRGLLLARDVAINILQYTGVPPDSKELPGLKCQKSEVEKPWARVVSLDSFLGRIPDFRKVKA